MVLAGRVDWLARQVKKGRRCHVSFGEARDADKLKIKIILYPLFKDHTVEPFVAIALCNTLTVIGSTLANSVAMDRGHRHSSGVSVVNTWISKQGAVDGVGGSPTSVDAV